MTWETINPSSGGRTSGGVSVSWRRTSNRKHNVLTVTIAAEICAALGVEKESRIKVERNRLQGRLRISVDKHGWKPRMIVTKGAACATLYVPLDDVTETRLIPAEAAPWEWDGRAVIVKLPVWACPPVKMTVGPKAIPLRDGKAA